MKYLFIFVLLTLISCTCKREKEQTNASPTPTREVQKEDNVPVEIEPFSDTLEVFADSVQIGFQKQNKILLTKFHNEKDCFIRVHLFKRTGNRWKLCDSLHLNECTEVNSLAAQLKDFNSDGKTDILFTSGDAARGGNIVQTLILFNSKTQKLIWVKNSENYPNLKYNKTLKCIESLILTGGSTYAFLNIKKDSLIEFAAIDFRDGRVSTETVEPNGKRKELKNVMIKEGQSMEKLIEDFIQDLKAKIR